MKKKNKFRLQFDLPCGFEKDKESKGQWYAYYDALNLITQQKTRKKARKSLQATVGMFVEGCIESGTLRAELLELLRK